MDTPVLVVVRLIDIDDAADNRKRRELLVRITREHTVLHLVNAIRQHVSTSVFWIEYKQHKLDNEWQIGDIIDNHAGFAQGFSFRYRDDGLNAFAAAPDTFVCVCQENKIVPGQVFPLDTPMAEIKRDFGLANVAWSYNGRRVTDHDSELSDVVGLDVAPLSGALFDILRAEVGPDFTFEIFTNARDPPILFTIAADKTVVEMKAAVRQVLGVELVEFLEYDDDFDHQPVYQHFSRNPPNVPIKLAVQTSQRDDSEKFVPIEPLRAVVDGKTMDLTGKLFEQVRYGDTVRLMPQDELSSTFYRISLEYEGEVKEVELNESQAIIIETSPGAPYLLLSPSGALKVHAAFRGSDGETLLQHVKVSLFESPNQHYYHDYNHGEPDEPEAANDGGFWISLQAFSEFARRASEVAGPIIERVFMYGLGILIFANMFGISMFLRFWYYAAGIATVAASFFAVFVAGENVADFLESLLPERPQARRTSYERAIQWVARTVRLILRTTQQTCTLIRTEIVRIVVRRPYDFELIINRDRNVWYRFATWLLIVFKDFLVFIITFFPQSAVIVAEEQSLWAAEEFDALKRQTKHFASTVDLLIDTYNQKFTPDYQLIDGCDYNQVEVAVNTEDDGEEVRERKYCLLIDCYRAYSHAYNSLNKALSTKTPLEGGRLREQN